jgi:hypothetical protein
MHEINDYCEHEWKTDGKEMFYSMKDSGEPDCMNTWVCELCYKLFEKEW